MSVMDEVLRAGLNAAKDRWHTPSGLVLALLMAAVVVILTIGQIHLASITLDAWLVVIAVAVAISTLWYLTRLPHVPRGHIGFGVAISSEEDEKNSTQCYKDFVSQLQTLLQGARCSHRFSFRTLGQAVSRRVFAEPDYALRVALRANIHFLLIGRIRTRRQGGQVLAVIDLRGLVRHGRLPDEVSKAFGDEIGSVLPSRILVPESQFVLSEVAATHVDIVARFVIATAALLTRDFVYAEQLLVDAEGRLRAFMVSAQGAQLSKLLDVVLGRLKSVYEIKLTRQLRRYTKSRDLELLADAELTIQELRQRDQDAYLAKTAAAMCQFVLHKDIPAARGELAGCRGIDDASWRYGEAFLFGYEGHLDDAYRSYRGAFAAPLLDESAPLQSEEFIAIVLEDEPDRYWLRFCLGLINHRAKRDFVAARRDFSQFREEAVAKGQFLKQVTAVEKWLRELPSD